MLPPDSSASQHLLLLTHWVPAPPQQPLQSRTATNSNSCLYGQLVITLTGPSCRACLINIPAALALPPLHPPPPPSPPQVHHAGTTYDMSTIPGVPHLRRLTPRPTASTTFTPNCWLFEDGASAYARVGDHAAEGARASWFDNSSSSAIINPALQRVQMDGPVAGNLLDISFAQYASRWV